MFYSVLALLVFEQYASSKHSGVISFFNKHFIKEGNFPNDPGSYLNKSFALRQRSDYREYIELSYDQVEPYLNKAQEFIDIVKMIINKK